MPPAKSEAAYQHWSHSGSLYLLTTPEGAHLPATASVEGFPLLVRLHKDFFDFRQAKASGEDLRFSSSTGEPLVYQIENWDAPRGAATIWVRMPIIRGNARQEIKMHWGKSDALSESNGRAVFNASNGYVGVWHMSEPVKDETGNLESKDTGATEAQGMVGPARHFPGQKGVFCGDKISHFPVGSSPSSTSAWLRSEVANGRVLGWGNEQAQGKVILNYRSPAHIRMECYFSGADVAGKTAVPRSEWVHVLHTYQKGESLLYVNGVLDGVTKTDGAPLNVRTPARMWIGGWYNVYDYSGDVDEVRISSVVRSAEWARLAYENQKPLQTLVGHLVQAGNTLAVTPQRVQVREGESAKISAQVGGADKVYWILKQADRETIVGTDRCNYTFAAGRVSGDEKSSLVLKAIYAQEVKTLSIPITIEESIPDPQFTLRAPAAWDGRAPIEVVPQIANLAELRSNSADKLTCTWTTADFAVTTEQGKSSEMPGASALRLTRAQNSGKLTVTATVSNGGAAVRQSVVINVTEPANDSWMPRLPVTDEKPQDHQFYARDDKNQATLFYRGTLPEPADAVFLKLYADGQLIQKTSDKVGADKTYALAVKLKPGLIQYKVELGTVSGKQETIRETVNNIVCGDAYLIAGQSNAVATDWGPGNDSSFRSPWIRTFGSMSGSPQGARLWGQAVHRSRDAEKLQIGYWGMELARRLVENQKMPICIINGAVGGTRIDQHQRNLLNPTDMSTIYGRLLWRVREARLTHGIRGVFWHQGESDQGADGPTGGYGYETYRQYFLDLAAAWKQDYPNIQNYYLFQIWPKSCSMGIGGSDNRLREVQRNLPLAFSRMGIMSTLGIQPPGGCHYPPAGYAEIARHICPLVERDNYGQEFASSITPPNLQRAYYSEAQNDVVVLQFDQQVKWEERLVSQFYLDGKAQQIASGSAQGNRIMLKLKQADQASNVSYLDSASWSQDNLLYGANGIAALTFCDVPILPPNPSP